MGWQRCEKWRGPRIPAELAEMYGSVIGHWKWKDQKNERKNYHNYVSLKQKSPWQAFLKEKASLYHFMISWPGGQHSPNSPPNHGWIRTLVLCFGRSWGRILQSINANMQHLIWIVVLWVKLWWWFDVEAWRRRCVMHWRLWLLFVKQTLTILNQDQNPKKVFVFQWWARKRCQN